tara:strand:- start:251 stop:601 length:351 start_codon:yes stop_codon:yes gene_type:complete
MAIVNKVEKRIKVNRDDVIKYQIVTYCFMNKVQISSSDLKCLLELAKIESIDLTNFCAAISEKKIFKSPQSCRNALQKSKRKGLIIKEGKVVSLNPSMKIQTLGTIYLDFKILGVD